MVDAGETNQDSIRHAYEIAVQMLIHEGELVWSRFNILLVAESVLAGFIGILIQSQVDRLGLRLGLSLLGIFLCIVWTLMNRRGFYQCGHYCRYLSEIEKSLPEGERFFHMAGQLSARFRFTIKGLSYSVIIAFAVFFIFALWL